MTSTFALAVSFLEGWFPFPLILLVLPVLFLAMGRKWSLRRSRVERVLLLGTSPLASKILRAFEARPQPRCIIVGAVDDTASPAVAVRRHPFLGPPERLGQIVRELGADRIIVAPGDRRGRLPVRELLEQRIRGVIIEDGAEAYERVTGKVAIESLRPGGLLFSEGFRSSLLQLALARGVSLLCAVVGLFALAPLLALVAVAIRMDSEGPVLFRHKRVGLGGKPFDLLKFRTMHAATRPRSEWVADNRERITRVGECLRRFRLDELPQLVNILRGDMNLVGPRPHPVSNFELFTKRIPFYSLRCLVRPGLTGWAQVRYGYANNLAEEIEKMRYDLYYIKHRSAWLDLQIIPATVKAVLAGVGAAEAEAVPPAIAPLARPAPDQNGSARLERPSGSGASRLGRGDARAS